MRSVIAMCIGLNLFLVAPRAQADEHKVKELIARLASDDAAARVHAADALGHLGGKAHGAVAALVKALDDPEEKVQWHAARALGSIGPEAAAAVEPLTARLKDEGALVRTYAAFALGRIGKASAPAVPALANAIKDPDRTVRRAAVKAIWAIKPPHEVIVPLFGDLLKTAEPAVLVPALDALVEAGPQAMPFLLDALKDEKGQYWACLVLAEMGPKAKEAVPEIFRALENEDAGVRREALLALGAIGDPRAVPAMVKALDDKASGARNAAALGLGRIGPAASEAAKPLEAKLADADDYLRATSLWSLAKIEPGSESRRQAATSTLARYLAEQTRPVDLRSIAAHGLADLKAPGDEAIAAFILALGETRGDLRHVASAALAGIGKPAVSALGGALANEKTRGIAAETLARIGPAAQAAVPALVLALGDQRAEVRDEALYALAAIGPEARQALAAIMRALVSDSDATVRHSAAYALGKIGPAAREAAPALRKALAGDDGFLAMTSAWALVKIDPKGTNTADLTVPLLIEALKHEERPVRLEAAEALGDLGARAAEATSALNKVLDDDDVQVRAAAAAALKKIEQ